MKHKPLHIVLILLLLGVLAAAVILWEQGHYLGRGAASMGHDDLPKPASDLPPAAKEAMNRIVNSEYAQSLKPLTALVKGKRVIGSDTGRSGFVLFLENDEWVAAYVQAGYLRWATGAGRPDAHQLQLID